MAQTQRITHGIQELWDRLSNNQRRVMIAAAFAVLVIMISGWLSSMAVTRELKQAERDAKVAAAEKQDAIDAAAAIAKKVEAAETEIKRLEEQRNEATERLEAAGRDADAARAGYDDAIRSVRGTITREQLCAELAELGYACR